MSVDNIGLVLSNLSKSRNNCTDEIIELRGELYFLALGVDSLVGEGANEIKSFERKLPLRNVTCVRNKNHYSPLGK